MTDTDFGMRLDPLDAVRGTAPSARHDPFILRLQRYVHLTKSDLESLLRVMECEEKVKRRRDLVNEGYVYSKLYFITDGFAARYKLLRNGKRQIVTFVLPGDIVGLPVSFFDRATYSVMAVTDMTMRVCSLEAFVALCYRVPKLALALSWFAVHEAATYSETIINIGRRTPVERVAHFLLEMHARLTTIGRAGKTGFDLPITQEMMSDALGLSVPHLNRMLARLRREGLIAITGSHVEFPDLKAIQQFVHFHFAMPTRIPLPPLATRQV
ncbi:MAG TPA: Crp/Fnr family transcriptional regulator [Xanthobacteraceae bacterium]|nr:Crp/Fnr family transcriptional regulator [Xanthobacteraceae bacterium]